MLITVVTFIGSFFGFAIFLLGVFLGLDRITRTRRARLRRYALVQSQERMDAVVARDRATPPTVLPGRMARLSMALAKAGIPLRAEVVLSLFAALVVVVSVLLHRFLHAPMLLLLPLSAGGGWAVFAGLIAMSVRLRAQAFTDELPDALDTLSRGLRAGRPVGDSIRLVAELSAGRVREEFARCAAEMRGGQSLADALDALGTRVGTPEARFISVATRLQAETGGNLIETFDKLADLVRETRKLKRKVKALSAETRVSGVILGSLPFGVGGVLLVLSPHYLLPLITDPRGHVMLGYGILSLILGILSMRRIGRLEV